MRTGNERKSSSSSPSPSPSLVCDVGLGLKMQTLLPTESYLCDVGGGGALYSYSSSPVAEDFNRTSDNTPGFFRNSSFEASGGGKALFTESQRRELERQNTIHRYILASIPVPPQLLHPSPPGSDSRFGSSDPEPWRCKRTDGKKWRCSRDVAPEHKYCERHAHKAKPRSRKHVEISSSSSSSPSPSLPAAPHPFHRSTSSSQIPTSMPTSYDQTRSIEWFMRGGNSKQQQQPRSEPHRDDNQSPSSYYDSNERRGFYVPDTCTFQVDSSPHSMSTTTTTRHLFVDAWEKDVGFDMGMSSKIKKPSPSSSLGLSMCGNWKDIGGIGYDRDDDVENRQSGIGMMSSSWMNSLSSSPTPPGGPLGEALCLGGNAGKNTSNGSKSSCEDGSHALDFVGGGPTDNGDGNI